MFLSQRFVPSGRALRYALVVAVAFSVGSASVAVAVPTISGFVGLIDGTNSAKINPAGELSTSDAGTHAALGQLQFDASGGLKVAPQGSQNVTGAVSVSNLPAVQNVSGTVSVSNLPAVQDVRETASAVVASAARITQTGSVITTSVNTGNYEQIRVNASSFAGCAAPVRVIIQAVVTTPQLNDAFTMDDVDVCIGQSYSKSFDIPGPEIQYSVVGPAGTDVRVAVVGR
jgi:hypothetical protein